MLSYDELLRALLAGAVAGLTVDLSLYPLDTIKTRLQSKEGFRAAGGFKNVYRGISSISLGSAPGSAFFFVTYNTSKKWVVKESPLGDAIRASIGELSACLVRVPTELVKQRAQVSNSQLKIVHIVKEILASRGLAGFYQGYGSTVLREIPFSFIEFPLWEFLKRRVVKWKGGQSCTPVESALCGSFAGFYAAAVTTPLDVIKTRVMLDKSHANSSFLWHARQVVKAEGIRRLYAGVVPRSLWMGIGGFIYFFAYEFAYNSAQLIRI